MSCFADEVIRTTAVHWGPRSGTSGFPFSPSDILSRVRHVKRPRRLVALALTSYRRWSCTDSLSYDVSVTCVQYRSAHCKCIAWFGVGYSLETDERKCGNVYGVTVSRRAGHAEFIASVNPKHLPPGYLWDFCWTDEKMVICGRMSLHVTADIMQWLKCKWDASERHSPPPIYGSKRSPTSDCYNATEWHTTIVRGPNLTVAFPHL